MTDARCCAGLVHGSSQLTNVRKQALVYRARRLVVVQYSGPLIRWFNRHNMNLTMLKAAYNQLTKHITIYQVLFFYQAQGQEGRGALFA